MTTKEKKLVKKVIGYFIIVILTVLSFAILTLNKEHDKELKLLAVKQPSGSVKYFKIVNNEKVNIDKITLESLMKQYDVVVEVKE